MRQALRFILPVVVLLSLFAWTTSVLVDRNSRRWFEADVAARSERAVGRVRDDLLGPWHRGDVAGLRRALDALVHQERLMAAAACGAGGETLATTAPTPELRCGRLLEAGAGLGVDPPVPPGEAPAAPRRWNGIVPLPDGRVYVSAVPIFDDGAALGRVMLVHDMRYADLREAAARRFTAVALGVLALAASLGAGFVLRASWRTWTEEILRLLRGAPSSTRREFQPLLRDVRDLVGRLSAETAAGERVPGWNADRLRRTLDQYLGREKVTIVANREPYIHQRMADGSILVQRPESGVVTALEPIMRACSGVWIAHGGGSADAQVADRQGRLRVPPGEESYVLRRLWLTPEEVQGYYYGFANEGLWPLCHMVDTRPTFRAADWEHYVGVNRKFAAAACGEAGSLDPILFVQDYHFALVPRLVRERLPRASLLTFWHIPWPSGDRFAICPQREDLLEGLLGSSILGFHTQHQCNNFIDAVDRFLEARIDREKQAVIFRGHTTLVRAYPISIEWPNRWLADLPPVPDCRREVRAELGLAPDVLLGLGVDRLDYTKGIEERLMAVEDLLERRPALRGRFTFVQLAAPSRTKIDRYRALAASVEAIAARVNARFGSPSWRPIILKAAHHEPPVVLRHYRAADVLYVSSLHDGMNLVAKEFVSARDDERGVLVLSAFTGAARELTEALIVNPYDIEEASEALHAALTMPAAEQQERMRSMRRLLAEFNVYRWAGQMLVDAGRVRQRGRVARRIRTSAVAERAAS